MSGGSELQKAPQGQITPPALTPDLVQQLLINQARELELRASDLALQKQKDDHAFEFGKESLAKKADDLRDQKKHESRKQIATFIFVGVLVLGFIGLIIYALRSGKDAFSMELIKAITFLVGGAIGGYGYAKTRSSKGPGSEPNDSGQ